MRSVIGERLRNCSGEKSGISLLRLAAVGPDHTARLRCLAAIGFFVQEFLRSKKTTQAAELTQHL